MDKIIGNLLGEHVPKTCLTIDEPNVTWPARPETSWGESTPAGQEAWIQYLVDTLDDVKKFTHAHHPREHKHHHHTTIEEPVPLT
jgi:spore cortex formation protein SpoVR/YcgB (stage V sporulation)